MFISVVVDLMPLCVLCAPDTFEGGTFEGDASIPYMVRQLEVMKLIGIGMGLREDLIAGIICRCLSRGL